MKQKPKVNPKFKKLVREAVRRHTWNMGVSNYVVDVLYMKEDLKVDRGMVEAEMDTNRRYLVSTMKVFPTLMQEWVDRKERGDEYVDGIIAHEVAHIVTAHLSELAVATYKTEKEFDDARETLTEVVSRMSVEIANLKK